MMIRGTGGDLGSIWQSDHLNELDPDTLLVRILQIFLLDLLAPLFALMLYIMMQPDPFPD